MNEYQIRFLKQAVLGQQVNMNDPDAVIKKCVELADRDMMSGGRFVSAFFLQSKKERVNYMMNELKKNGFDYTKIDKKKICNALFWTCDEEKTKTVKGTMRCFKPFGLAQKLVNMTYKYLYVYREHIGDIKLDFTMCDCPVDSVVLQKLGSDLKWTNMTAEEYGHTQDEIIAKLEDEKYSLMKAEIGALAFDDNWINGKSS